MKWNDDWRQELEREDEPCFTRLCECRNTKRDMFTMAKLLYKYNSDKSAEECLDRICEWVCCWNSQFNMELTEFEYNKYLARLLRQKVS